MKKFIASIILANFILNAGLTKASENEAYYVDYNQMNKEIASKAKNLICNDTYETKIDVSVQKNPKTRLRYNIKPQTCLAIFYSNGSVKRADFSIGHIYNPEYTYSYISDFEDIYLYTESFISATGDEVTNFVRVNSRNF